MHVLVKVARKELVQINEELMVAYARLKMFAMSLVIVFLCLYTAALIGGAGMQLARGVWSISGVGVVCIVLLFTITMDSNTASCSAIHDAVLEQPLLRMCYEMFDSDLMHAVGLFAAAPLFLAYLCLCFIKQLCRRAGATLGGFCCEPVKPPEEHSVLTSTVVAQLRKLSCWNWTRVLILVNYIALAAWTLLFGSTLTYMAAGILINWLKAMSWHIASLLFVLIGLVMFLLPPVPGAAVYLSAGILIVPACEEPFGGGEKGFWLAVTYASLLSWVIKLIAHVAQQIIIGEALGRSVKVRHTVGVNSSIAKAIKCILSERGLTAGKVCILCGGPDWPTAVMCGILGQNLRQMLLCVVWVVFYSAPCAMAGAFQLKASDGPLWESLATLMLGFVALETVLLMMLALFLIEEVRSNAPRMMESIPDDPEVAALERENAAAAAMFECVTSMDVMPCTPKTLLISGTLVISMSAYLLILASSLCFEDFALTDDVHEVLCLRCERAAIKEPGWIALGMLAYGLATLKLFFMW
eukprot:CAMPEP_0119348768 /NCGR_PEP_ID=MMETSP1333-20130426/109213_1 /TAXON_ID=418940 /ORGANISM="Scyphosphaera apsteinii, Strain RCC1455" /LENGTH=525 /DNA_ID=CAMNT_0007361359 /DNA_START=1230 /DNA_END=2804 /DNA_ORIENTATION=+